MGTAFRCRGSERPVVWFGAHAPSTRGVAALLEPSPSECGRMARTQDAQLFSEIAAGFAMVAKDKASRNRTARFKAWLASARRTELNAFVRGIDRDHDAVLAALAEPCAQGPSRGKSNRLGLLKRGMSPGQPRPAPPMRRGCRRMVSTCHGWNSVLISTETEDEPRSELRHILG